MTLVQVAQHADDLTRAATFYTKLLRKEPSGHFDPPGLLFFDLGGTRLLLESGAPSAVLYLKVENIAEEVERIASFGAELVSAPHLIFTHENDALGPADTEEWQAAFKDSEGNTVLFVEWRPIQQ
jgi:methylmalonyl-CoA/ethylmalonyl-CoA epimerase